MSILAPSQTVTVASIATKFIFYVQTLLKMKPIVLSLSEKDTEMN